MYMENSITLIIDKILNIYGYLFLSYIDKNTKSILSRTDFAKKSLIYLIILKSTDSLILLTFFKYANLIIYTDTKVDVRHKNKVQIVVKFIYSLNSTKSKITNPLISGN